MATNLSKRLDRLERLLRERTAASTAPLFVRDPVRDGVDPDRVTFIVRTFVAPPERVEDELPAPQELSSNTVEPQRQERREPLEYPPLGLA